MSNDQGDPTFGDQNNSKSLIKSFASAISHFDWLKLPGAVRAISRLVIGLGDASAAWADIAQAKGEQRSQSIRDTTEARSRVLEALAKIAIERAIGEPELVDRAIQHLVIDQFTKQRNREAIATEAIELLEEQPIQEQTPAPDDDWLNVFAAHAEKANTDRMRKHWAAILAGEIRAPGSFSLMSLQILSIMDQQLATIITEVRGWIVQDDNIPLTESLSKGERYTKLLSLDSIGFLRLGNTKFLPPTGPGQVSYFVGSRAMLVRFDQEIQYGAAILTQAGREILKIVPGRIDDAISLEVAELFRSRGATIISLFHPR